MNDKKNYIVSISYLYRGGRAVVKARGDGSFRLPVNYLKEGALKTSYKNLTAGQAVRHELIKDADPVLTLNTGEKVRVYTGGDSSYLPAMSEGIIMKHDKKRNVQKLREKMIKKSLKSKEESYCTDSYDIFNLGGWGYEDS